MALWDDLISSLNQRGGGFSPFAQAYNPWTSTGAAQSAYAGGAGPNPAQFMPAIPAGGVGQIYGMSPAAMGGGGGGMGAPNMQGANALMAQMAAQGGPLAVARASGLNPIVSPGFAPPPTGGQTYGIPMAGAGAGGLNPANFNPLSPLQTANYGPGGPPPGVAGAINQLQTANPSGFGQGYMMPGGGNTLSSFFGGGKGPRR